MKQTRGTSSVEAILESIYKVRRKAAEGFLGKKHLAVTPSQGFALSVIARQKTAAAKDVAQELKMTSSAATQVVDELVKKGYVLRKGDPKDRRAVVLTLSPKAKGHMKSMKQEMLKHITKLLKVLTPAERAEYARLIKKIADAV